ncbi:MAG: hypothetical protein II059_13325 [Clostridia bacterium]|nr:hypothetical protein [Clostridia bacterium]
MLIVNVGLTVILVLLMILTIRAAYKESNYDKLFSVFMGFVVMLLANSIITKKYDIRMYLMKLVYHNYLFAVPIGIVGGIILYLLAKNASMYLYGFLVLSKLVKNIKKGEKYSEFVAFMEKNGENVIHIEPHYGSGGFSVSYVPSGKIFIKENGQLKYNDNEAKQSIFFNIDDNSERYWTTDEENALNDIVEEAAEKYGLEKENQMWNRPLIERKSVLKDPY